MLSSAMSTTIETNGIEAECAEGSEARALRAEGASVLASSKVVLTSAAVIAAAAVEGRIKVLVVMAVTLASQDALRRLPIEESLSHMIHHDEAKTLPASKGVKAATIDAARAATVTDAGLATALSSE